MRGGGGERLFQLIKKYHEMRFKNVGIRTAVFSDASTLSCLVLWFNASVGDISAQKPLYSLRISDLKNVRMKLESLFGDPLHDDRSILREFFLKVFLSLVSSCSSRKLGSKICIYHFSLPEAFFHFSIVQSSNLLNVYLIM